ncbi:hypothetical protein ACFU53_08800 [Streptomyces sp. NPDC057474]|uniref:hypothetical protein n=1 Tax=Streptomyces sp. NPDC057474 TaxID=3346144 RepID=UPI0036CF08B9
MRSGEQFAGRFVLREVIGAGRSGDVWLAHDTVVGQDVALKPERIEGDHDDSDGDSDAPNDSEDGGDGDGGSGAADGTDVDACFDGRCELAVSQPMSIEVDSRFGVGDLRVTKVTGDNVLRSSVRSTGIRRCPPR